MTLEEYAKKVGVSPRTIYRKLRQGKITAEDIAKGNIAKGAALRIATKPPKGYFTVAYFARAQQVSIQTVHNWLRDGKIEGIKTPEGRVFINPFPIS